MATPANPLPRWRGFNLLELFTPRTKGDFREDDFRWLSDWGFDFVRIPMDYHFWVSGDDFSSGREDVLAKIDGVVELGRKYGVHVMLNLHRAPGYCINPPPEPFNLWKEEKGLQAFCAQWRLFARRYKGIPSSRLSFDLVNEPPAVGATMSRADHERVIRAATAAIREIDPERTIIADGINGGNEPAYELADLKINQACRAYLPMGLSHYKAGWVEGSDKWPVPAWPGAILWTGGQAWDRGFLEMYYHAWASLMYTGTGVFCGEGGAYKETPHDVALAWLTDVLEILASLGIGYALWNFRGDFGVLDSGRADVAYEDWHGHKLDGKLLDLLRRF